MRLMTTTLIAAGLLTLAPGFVDEALAHGGSYRGPAGEVPPDSRDPSDPPPPPEGGGPTTPGGETGGPTTGGGVGGGPTTGGGESGGPSTGGGPGGPSPGGGGPSGPITGGGTGGRGGRGGGKGIGYEDWTFWWNFNKDEILQLKSAVKATQTGNRTGGIAHKFGKGAAGAEVKTATDASIQNKIVPMLRAMLDEKDLNFDIQSAAAIALAKIGDESIVDTLKKMALNEKAGGNYHKVVTESAGLAFGLLQKDDADVRSFLIQIVQDKENNSSFVRPFCAISLGLLGEANAADPKSYETTGQVIEALEQVIAGKESKDDIKSACLVAMGLLGNDAAVPKLIAMIETGKAGTGGDPLTDVELAFAIQALGKIGAPGLAQPGKENAVVDVMIDVLNPKNKKANDGMRRSAAIALGQLAPQCTPKKQEDVLKQLKDTATDKKTETSTRNFAMIAIGRIGATDGVNDESRKQAITTLQYLLESAKPANIGQPFAALSLGLIGRTMTASAPAMLEEEIRKPLREKFAETKDPRARGAFAIASGLVRDPLATTELVKALDDRGADGKLRGYCAVALGMIGAPDAKEAIKKTLTDGNDRELRVQTAVAAGLMGDASVIQPLVDILKSGEESQYILGSVALALGQIGDERAIEPLVEIASDSEKKYPDLTRALATVALGQIGDRRDVPVLARVARDINYRAHVPALAELLTIL